MMRPEYDDGTVQVFHAEHQDLAAHLRESGIAADCLCADPPYSAKTHEGHLTDGLRDGADRRAIDYASWSSDDVEVFVTVWARLVRGWFCTFTDHRLTLAWEAAHESAAGGRRNAFHPIPCVERGMTVRMCGGGPSSWATYLMVARPRTLEWSRWQTTQGAYIGPREEKSWVGGKPVWLVREVLRDYSEPGNLIVDPTCGGGTLGVAVRYEGRRAILADRDPLAVETTIKRLRGERTKPTRDDFPETPEQPTLFRKDAP